ncbi:MULTISPECIES: hypothetical protein [Rahnella]|uniref:Morphogenetic protein n=1 Tax=Rahnella laticis TaxID=2787622 RepID=A0ABS0E0L0_9GAMM|nr:MULTISPECIES: hypothetical protein [Rahnella]MBF7978610.1 hypothetical protein [Rahnella laticis]MBF7998700.1 hypothetical protein [Rahnella sp. LAC-M12]
MKERPILFNAEMVKAILSGRKTQTRRLVKFPIIDVNLGCELAGNELAGEVKAGDYRNCPLGQPGDQFWVRETFSLLGNEDGCPVDWNDNIVTDKKDAARIYKASCWQKPNNYGIWSVPDREIEFDGAWTPSIHMPRWASRIDLLITGVRVERLNDISVGDVMREGCSAADTKSGHRVADVFVKLWESIYGEGSWQANPWVWVIEFKRVAPAGEQP